MAAQGCDGVECGEGTVERGGDCVIDQTLIDTCKCGTGAHFDAEEEQCLPDHAPAVCNTETTVEEIIDGDVTLCNGDCGGGCPSACPPPAAGHVTVCGELIDVETGARITSDGGGTGADCDEIPIAERTGPCLLEVAIHAGLEWPAPASIGDVEVDDCGFYVAANVPAPGLGLVMLSLDDAEGTSSAETWVATATAAAVSSGERLVAQKAYAVRRSTDSAWTTAAGSPFGGLTFSEKGVLAFRFFRADISIEEVTITRSPEGVVEDSDFYFSDTGRQTWATIDPAQDDTGVNGVGFIVDTPLADHRGQGGLPECTWPTVLRRSFPGLVLVEEIYAVSPGGGPC